MDYVHLPKQIITYIPNLYSKLKGIVETHKWKTNILNFPKEVFQWDPFNGVLFLVVFNPLLEYIKQHKETHRYELKTKTCANFVNTTPFADDFNIISRHSTKHDALLKDVENKLVSIGLVLKASKYKSLSIQGGRTTNHQFTLNKFGKHLVISSVLEKPKKYLGSEVLEDSSPSGMYALMKTKLETKL